MLEADADVIGHVNGGHTSLSYKAVCTLCEKSSRALEIVHNGNERIAILTAKHAMELKCPHRVILGTAAGYALVTGPLLEGVMRGEPPRLPFGAWTQALPAGFGLAGVLVLLATVKALAQFLQGGLLGGLFAWADFGAEGEAFCSRNPERCRLAIRASSISACGDHSLLVDQNNRLWAWGANVWRQLGKEMQVDEMETGEIGGSYADTMSSLLSLLSHPDEFLDPGTLHFE